MILKLMYLNLKFDVKKNDIYLTTVWYFIDNIYFFFFAI